MPPSIALLVYTQVLPPSARSYLCMYRNKQRASTRTWLSSPMSNVGRARLRMRCVGALYRPMPDPSVGWASSKRDKPVNSSSDRATRDRVARARTSFFFLPLLVCPHACANQLLRLHRVPQPRRKPSWEKNNLAGVPDNRCNSSARVRMEYVIAPSWPLPRTSFQVNITVSKQITVSKRWFSLPSGGKCC